MELREQDLDQSPFRQFGDWFQSATDAGLREPNAMSLATVSDKGTPSLRTVLLKVWDANGFVPHLFLHQSLSWRVSSFCIQTGDLTNGLHEEC